MDFATVHVDLTWLVRRFGPHRRRVPTAEPFWRLQNDGVWEIDQPELVSLDTSGSAHISDLRQHGIMGGLLESDYNAIRADPNLAWRIATSLLADHFPDTLHDEILRATGFFETPIVGDDTIVISTVAAVDVTQGSETMSSVRTTADARSANNPWSCMGMSLPWRQLIYAGTHMPDLPKCERTVAMCAAPQTLRPWCLHTSTRSQHLVSSHLAGIGSQAAIEQYHDSLLLVLPELDSHKPALEFLQWHRGEVFRA